MGNAALGWAMRIISGSGTLPVKTVLKMNKKMVITKTSVLVMTH